MNRIFSATLYLETEPGPAAPDGPGWYVDIRSDNGSTEIAPKVRVSQPLAGLIGAAYEKAIANKPLNFTEGMERSDTSVGESVRLASEAARGAIAEELRKAEEIAQRLAELRRTYEEFGGE